MPKRFVQPVGWKKKSESVEVYSLVVYIPLEVYFSLDRLLSKCCGFPVVIPQMIQNNVSLSAIDAL